MGEVRGDPARLEDYTATTAPTVAPTLAGVDEYTAALRAFSAAGPNDLGGPVLTDHSGRIEGLLEELQVLDDLPAAFAAALRTLDRSISCDPHVEGLRRAADDELFAAAVAARLRDPGADAETYAEQVAQLQRDREQGNVWRGLGAVGAAFSRADDLRGAVTQVSRTTVNGRRVLTARGRLTELERSLRTAGDFLDESRLSRRERRILMREHNRPITNQLPRARTDLNAQRARFRGNRSLTGLPERLGTRFPGAARALRVGGKVLGGAGILLSFADIPGDVSNRDWGGVAANTAAIAGTAILLTATAPVTLTVGAVAVTGALVYEFRGEIADAGRFVAGKVSGGVKALGKKLFG